MEELIGIGLASRLIGRRENTLREWEREGLIKPNRTSSGMRVFSQDDIEHLRHIAASRKSGRPRKR
jgi:MerR family transcriptional regulator/heat shock protein HspR